MDETILTDEILDENINKIAKSLSGGILTTFNPNITPQVLTRLFEKCKISENDSTVDKIFKIFIFAGNAQQAKKHTDKLCLRTEKNRAFQPKDISDVIRLKESSDNELTLFAKSMYFQQQKYKFLAYQINKLLKSNELQTYDSISEDYDNFEKHFAEIPISHLVSAILNKNPDDLFLAFHSYCSSYIKNIFSRNEFKNFIYCLEQEVGNEYTISYRVNAITCLGEYARDAHQMKAEQILESYNDSNISIDDLEFKSVLSAYVYIDIKGTKDSVSFKPNLLFVNIDDNYYFLHTQNDFINNFLLE